MSRPIIKITFGRQRDWLRQTRGTEKDCMWLCWGALRHIFDIPPIIYNVELVVHATFAPDRMKFVVKAQGWFWCPENQHSYMLHRTMIPKAQKHLKVGQKIYVECNYW